MAGKKTVDVRGHACPIPIIKTSLAMKEAASGEVFEVIANDLGFHRDIKAWCDKTQNTLEGIAIYGNETIATIRKG